MNEVIMDIVDNDYKSLKLHIERFRSYIIQVFNNIKTIRNVRTNSEHWIYKSIYDGRNVWHVCRNYYWNVIVTDYRDTPWYYKVSVIDIKTDRYVLDVFVAPEKVMIYDEKPTFILVDDEIKFNILRNKYLAISTTDDPHLVAYNNTLNDCRNFISEIKTKFKSLLQADWNQYSREIEDLIDQNKRYTKITYDTCSTTLTNKNRIESLKQFISTDFESMIDRFVTINNNSFKAADRFKEHILYIILDIYTNDGLRHVRSAIYNKLQKEGIESIVSNVSIDSSVNLGDFKSICFLVEHGTKSYQDIVSSFFRDETDPKMLEKLLTQTLKLYYDFQNVSEKNSAYLTEFLIKNKLTKSKFKSDVAAIPNCTERLWPLLSTKEKDTYIKLLPTDSTYRIKKNAYIRKGIRNTQDINGHWVGPDSTVVFGQDLLEKMKAIAVAFNEENDHTRILSIEFGNEDDNEKKSFVMEFITYKIEDKEIDGRRLGAFTAMFNRAFNDTLYLTYE